ncbi:hypothetical protein [Planctomicrobium sp. SH527]|uniref:hypothetical protein n=1 Tax=Planctomicrobium sp. SH527 TaxID=3448123 RepID=UPI003F5CB5A2
MNNYRLTTAEWVCSLCLTGVVLWLIFARFHAPGGIWRDEAACVQLATMPTVTDVWNHFEHEAFPPPFPLLLRAYLQVFGTSIEALRGFGLIVSCLIVVSIWLTNWLLLSRPPLISLALVGLNTTTLFWGGSVRGYGMASIFAPLAFACMARYLKTPTVAWGIAALTCTILSVQWALQNSVLVFAICVSAALVAVAMPSGGQSTQAIASRLKSAALILLIGFVSALSLVFYIPRYAAADWKRVVEREATLQDYISGLLFTIGRPVEQTSWVWIGLAITAFIGTCIACSRRNRTDEKSSNQLAFSWLVIGFALCCYFSFLMVLQYRARPWYFLPLTVLLSCTLEYILSLCFQAGWFRIARIGLVIVLMQTLTGPNLQLLKTRVTNIDLAARILEERADDEDLIVVSPWYYGVSFRWHYHGNTKWVTLPILGDLAIHRYDLVVPRMKSATPLEDLKEEIQATLQNGKRIWVLGDLLPVPDTGPTILKPAPDPEAKWIEELYIASWMEQMTAYMQQHCRTIGEVEIECPEPVAAGESIQLWQGSGWKSSLPNF